MDDPPDIIRDVIRQIRKLPKKMKGKTAERKYIGALGGFGTHFLRKVVYGAYFAKLLVVKEKDAKRLEDRFFIHNLNSCN